MIVHDFDVPSVTIAELEGDPPRPAGGDGPLVTAGTAKAVEADGCKTGQISKSLSLVEQSQSAASQ